MKLHSMGALILTAALAVPSSAQTLERVRSSNTLTLGYADQLQPFSSGPVEAPVGYTIELCRRIAERIKHEQGLPQLKVVYRQVAREQLLAAVQKGEIDLLCSPLVASLERRHRVSFSLPVYPSGRGVVVREDVSPVLLLVLEDKVERTTPQWRATINRGLARGTFAVIGGSITEQWVRQTLRMAGVLSTVVPVQSFAEGVELLATGKADAFFGDRVVLQQLAAGSPEKLMVIDRIFEMEPAALALPRGDEDLRLLVDTELSLIYRSGEIEPLYRQYFGEPGEQVRTLFRAYALP